MAKKVTFAKKPAAKKKKGNKKKGKQKADPLAFNFGANVAPKGKRRGGKGGGS